METIILYGTNFVPCLQMCSDYDTSTLWSPTGTICQGLFDAKRKKLFPPTQGATRGGGKAPPPPLSQVKIKKKIKILDSFDVFLCLSDLKLCDLVNLCTLWWRYKDYVTENMPSKWRHKIFHFQAPPLAKSWLRSCQHLKNPICIQLGIYLTYLISRSFKPLS